MTREERIAICKTCENKRFNAEKGMVCSLTNEHADFLTTCADYVVSQEAIEQQKKDIAHAEKVKKGKQILKKIILGYLCFVVLSVIVNIIADNFTSAQLLQTVIREAVALGLFFVAFNGYKWARNIIIALFSIAILLFTVPLLILLKTSLIVALPLLCVLVFYGLCIYYLIFDKNVNSIFEDRDK